MNPSEMFSRDDKTKLREWYREGVANAIWADDEDERHLAGLMEVARCAAVAGYEEAKLEPERKGWKHDEAAADEVDRLRAAEYRAYADRAQALVSLAKQLDTNAHLRAVIENAPHANGCSWFNTAAGLSCNCWKGDAP